MIGSASGMPNDSVGPGTVLAGDFRLLEPLSSGGMGAVFVAEQLSTGRRRAVKVMHAGLLDSQSLRERFQREARIGSLVSSDHVVEVVSAGIDPATGAPFIAMELLDGEDLARYVTRLGPLSPERVLELLRQICHALGAAHAAGVVHRDIKPENIFVVSSKNVAPGSLVKLLDFGIARIAAQMRTAHTGVIGTPLWMAPEQTDPSGEAGPAADVWAIGLLAFWMLTGRHFWRSASIPSSSMHALMREILFDAIPTGSERAAQLGAGGRIPHGFDAWLASALSREPQARFANGSEAFYALESALGAASTRVSLSHTAVSPPPFASQKGAFGRALWLAVPVLGVGALGLVVAALGAAYYAGLFDDLAKPTPAASEAPSVEQAPAANPVEPPAASVTPEPRSTPVAARPARAGTAPSAPPPAAPAPAPKPFDHSAAQTALQQRASFAKLTCSSKPGPRAFAPAVQFRNNGSVQKISMSPRDMATESGICVHMILSGARAPAYDGPLQSASVGVTLDP
jgi:eukaryotic-like serine/threonine-protein kinase